MINLTKIAVEIREIINIKQKELGITFVEETHKYTIIGDDGSIVDYYPSVSSIIEKFYKKFDDKSKSLSMCDGDINKQKKLLLEWKQKADYSTNMGSRVHYELEKELVSRYGNYKKLRQPEFICDSEQIEKSDKMIIAGNNFLNLMINERKAVLLDTETVLGSNRLKYFGTPDKVWLVLNKKQNDFLLYITDWKTNQPKNFEVQPYTDKMYKPFNNYPSTALSHYYIQLPLYARLLFDMLKGTKYENIKLGGCIVVLLKDNATYQEYKVPKDFIDEILNIDLTKYVNIIQ